MIQNNKGSVAQIKKSFDKFEGTMSNMLIDLNFWEHVINDAIRDMKAKRIAKQFPIYTSTFAAYDIPLGGSPGILKTPHKHYAIMVDNLDQEKAAFFDWLGNYSIIRAYLARSHSPGCGNKSIVPHSWP